MTQIILAAIAALQQPASQQPSFAPSLFMFGMIFLIFYFLIIRPQQRQRKAHEQSVLNVKKGDRIVTSGGIIGDIIHIRETVKDGTPQRSMDDEVTIRSGESRLIIERGRIAKIISETGAAAAAPKESRQDRQTGT